MSAPNKRKLAEATHRLVHLSAPDMPEFEAVTAALAQVFTDVTGIPCTIVMKIKPSDFNAALARESKEAPHG